MWVRILNFSMICSIQSVYRLAVNSMHFLLLNFVLFLIHTCSCFLPCFLLKEIAFTFKTAWRNLNLRKKKIERGNFGKMYTVLQIWSKVIFTGWLAFFTSLFLSNLRSLPSNLRHFSTRILGDQTWDFYNQNKGGRNCSFLTTYIQPRCSLTNWWPELIPQQKGCCFILCPWGTGQSLIIGQTRNFRECGRRTGENVSDHYLQPLTGNQMLLKYIKRVFSNPGLPAQGEQVVFSQKWYTTTLNSVFALPNLQLFACLSGQDSINQWTFYI